MRYDVKVSLSSNQYRKITSALTDPLLADFVENLDIVNAAAEQADGFVWRLKDESGAATGFRHFGPDCIVNMSVWKDLQSLRKYIMSEPHLSVMKQKRNWFLPMDTPYLALWWVPKGTQPSLAEADEKLQLLFNFGPTSDAFTFQKSFPATRLIEGGGNELLQWYFL